MATRPETKGKMLRKYILFIKECTFESLGSRVDGNETDETDAVNRNCAGMSVALSHNEADAEKGFALIWIGSQFNLADDSASASCSLLLAQPTADISV